MNPLENRPAIRQHVYDGLWTVGLALGGAQVGYAAADAGQPTWLTVAIAVFTFIAAGVGYTASRNVTKTS